MVQINRELVRAHTAEYRRVFDALESCGDAGFLLHCSAGKDRTGLGAAAIQLALGVPRELVVEDYLLTNEAMDFERFIVPRLKPHYGDVDVEAAMALSGVRAEYIHAALDEIDSAFGSIDAYLRDGLGIDERRRAALRERYME
jgi:protein-tyrosine phosphatase